MTEEPDVILVKKMEYKRVDCTCGVAVMSTDPTPDISEAIKNAAREFGVRFRILDTSEHPNAVLKYHIKELPAVVIGEMTYPADVEVVRNVLGKLSDRESTGKSSICSDQLDLLDDP